jgi:steroid delta-isomerase-like uncharacterized protein
MDAIEVARDSIEGFNAGDWERVKAGLAPDSVYEEAATGRLITGADGIVEALQGWKQAFPDATGTVKGSCGSGDTAALEITWEGTQQGPLEGPGGAIPASNKRASVEAVQVVRVRDGKITENRHFFDMLGLLQQLGAAPN